MSKTYIYTLYTPEHLFVCMCVHVSVFKMCLVNSQLFSVMDRKRDNEKWGIHSEFLLCNLGNTHAHSPSLARTHAHRPPSSTFILSHSLSPTCLPNLRLIMLVTEGT